MKIQDAICAAQCVAIAFLTSGTVAAQDISRAFLCDGITGFIIGAPEWQPQPDGYANTKILISCKTGDVLSHVTSFRNGARVYDADGLGIAMNAGFSVAVFSKEYTETYVVNVGTLELFYSHIRAGSGMLPNSIKSFRGICKPAGELVR